MRYAIALAVLCLGMAALAVRGQEASPSVKAIFEKNLGKLVKVEPTPITGEALGKVFAAEFYRVKVNLGDEGDSKLLVVACVGENLSQVSLPGANAEMAALKVLVKPGFKLKAESDGQAFEAALDLLYPFDSRYDEKRKAMKHMGTEWTFIRGVFINDYKGLVVTTDAEGTITSIKFSREIKNGG